MFLNNRVWANRTMDTYTKGNIVVARFMGRMIGHQTRRLSLIVQEAIAEMGSVRLLLAVESLGKADSLYEGLHFARLHADHIERIALVGNRPVEKTYAALFGLFGGVEVEYFDRSRLNEALHWLESP